MRVNRQLSFVVYYEGNEKEGLVLEEELRIVVRKILPESKINVFKKEHKLNSPNGERT